MLQKIVVIGAGNVGSACAHSIALQKLAHHVVLLDIKEGVAEGKALDILQSLATQGNATQVTGVTNEYTAIEDADLVVITSGRPRQPGMSRDDLIKINAEIVQGVAEKIIHHAPKAIIIVVSNPLDVMTYVALKTTKKSPQTVFGMAGTLDVARYKAFLAQEIGVDPTSIQALLLGGHGDTMVPLPRYTSVGGIPVTELLPKEKIDAIITRTQNGGGEFLPLLGTTAWLAPGAAVAQLIAAIAHDTKTLLPVCAYLDGQYGQTDICLGVPVILGKNGIEKIIELDLHPEEKTLLVESARAVTSVISVWKNTA